MSASSVTLPAVSALTAASRASVRPIIASMVNGADGWPAVLRIVPAPGSKTSR
jgi:hypothetical protein